MHTRILCNNRTVHAHMLCILETSMCVASSKVLVAICIQFGAGRSGLFLTLWAMSIFSPFSLDGWGIPEALDGRGMGL